jgi:STE24 endopeptidase
LAITLGLWWSGAFGWLDGKAAGVGWGTVGNGLWLMAVLFIGSSLLSLPLDLWRTFGVETEFGFNKTSLRTFLMDRLKGLILAAALGLPLMALLLWLFESSPLAALWSWLVVTAWGLLMTWLAPRFIMPLFHRFEPMPEGELRQAILALADRLKFPVADISVIDGSRRSTKANAFFAGFGKTRRIALFDTLIQGYSTEEIVAVLAHEIGHAKLSHVPRQILMGLFLSGLMFALLHVGLHDERLFSAFGVGHPSVAMGMVLFMIVYSPWSRMFDPLVSYLSRKHEFEADRFAAQAVGSSVPLATALKKLSHDHLAHLTPHPLYVWLHYSHPPLTERLAALAKA